MKRILFFAGLWCAADSHVAAQRLSNWVAQVQPCDQSSELLKRDHMELGVWVNTEDSVLAAEFRRAMNFWANVLDMSWRERNTRQCSIQVVYGTPSLFWNKAVAARSQFVDHRNFHGWIAFNPECKLSNSDTYVTAIHEVGHMLGLSHNPNPRSVMFFLDPEDPPALDSKDLASLGKRHRLRYSLTALQSRLFERVSHAQ